MSIPPVGAVMETSALVLALAMFTCILATVAVYYGLMYNKDSFRSRLLAASCVWYLVLVSGLAYISGGIALVVWLSIPPFAMYYGIAITRGVRSTKDEWKAKIEQRQRMAEQKFD